MLLCLIFILFWTSIIFIIILASNIRLMVGILNFCFSSISENLINIITSKCKFANIKKFGTFIYTYISEKIMAPHFSTLAWKIPWMEEPGRLQSMGLWRVGHDLVTSLSLFTFTFHFHALEKEMATHTSVLAWRIPGTGEPGELPLWGHTESDRTEVT